MGACIGKKSSKYLNRKSPQSDTIQTAQPKIQNDILDNKSSSSPSKKLPVTDSLPTNNDDLYRTSKLDENSIDSEIQIILDEQKIINDTLCQPFPSRMVSATETELEYELANLLFEYSENSVVENPLTATTVKSDDRR